MDFNYSNTFYYYTLQTNSFDLRVNLVNGRATVEKWRMNRL